MCKLTFQKKLNVKGDGIKNRNRKYSNCVKALWDKILLPLETVFSYGNRWRIAISQLWYRLFSRGQYF